MEQLLKLSISDFKLVFRDPSLRIFLFLPILIFLVINYFLPYLIGKFPEVNDYVIYVVIVATIETVQMFGFIYSMVLIDEKETEVAKMYGVLPVSRRSFVISRLIIPSAFTSIIAYLILILQPFYEISSLSLFAFSIFAGALVPIYVIGIVNMCRNRMEGMVWIKVFNVIVLLPIIAFFVPGFWQNLFGILPTHWLFQMLFHIINSEAYHWQLIAGLIYFGILLFSLSKKFSKIHFT